MTYSMMKFVLPFSLTRTANAQSGLLFDTHYVLGGFWISCRKQLCTFLMMNLSLDKSRCFSSAIYDLLRWSETPLVFWSRLPNVSQDFPVGVGLE